jgi:hypothetical protein
VIRKCKKGVEMKSNTLISYSVKKISDESFAYKQWSDKNYYNSYSLSNIIMALSNYDSYYGKHDLRYFVYALKVGTEISVNVECRNLGEYL